MRTKTVANIFITTPSPMAFQQITYGLPPPPVDNLDVKNGAASHFNADKCGLCNAFLSYHRDTNKGEGDAHHFCPA